MFFKTIIIFFIQVIKKRNFEKILNNFNYLPENSDNITHKQSNYKCLSNNPINTFLLKITNKCHNVRKTEYKVPKDMIFKIITFNLITVNGEGNQSKIILSPHIKIYVY